MSPSQEPAKKQDENLLNYDIFSHSLEGDV